MNWKLQADHLEIYYWSRQLCERKLGRICHFSWFALLIFSAESRRLSSDGSSDISSTWHRMISSSISSTIILTNHSATATSNFSLFFLHMGTNATPHEKQGTCTAYIKEDWGSKLFVSEFSTTFSLRKLWENQRKFEEKKANERWWSTVEFTGGVSVPSDGWGVGCALPLPEMFRAANRRPNYSWPRSL